MAKTGRWDGKKMLAKGGGRGGEKVIRVKY